jgi:seryl-tRNA synthetase
MSLFSDTVKDCTTLPELGAKANEIIEEAEDLSYNRNVRGYSRKRTKNNSDAQHLAAKINRLAKGFPKGSKDRDKFNELGKYLSESLKAIEETRVAVKEVITWL